MKEKKAKIGNVTKMGNVKLYYRSNAVEFFT